ncbi:4-hydroxybenzoyl-CoA thioesterase [Hylemonella gracilis str. Niagara R]|uniref:4-hydroxybenzoyl-CoA thioesterase n=1 Tax=Hylemonella gracilis str. Niagara R TaxID=1458275 RepID=A0A016XH47_9BURK|nr:tol-pal system-associated acyl-CoA thioesterase [Hylemonella gracilis]EYC50892.1 4-hydroxybenzoyl-CoA thioesterase [Hylemonella gracilis str. Niagara R]
MSERTHPATFTWPVRVYWEDTDAGGIVFYANYLKFFERARTEWLRALGIDQHALRETTGGMFVVSAADIRYHRPARLDDVLAVSAELSASSRASLTIAQTATLGEHLLCQGNVHIAWVDAVTLHPARLPEAVLRALPALPALPPGNSP